MYECEDCGYVTKYKRDLLRHKNRINPCARSKPIIENKNIEKNEKKQICENIHSKSGKFAKTSTVFAKTSTFSEQEICENIHSDINQYQCKKCNKLFKSRRNLKDHISLCDGIDSLTCPRCFKRFKSIKSKYNHISNVLCEENANLQKYTPNPEINQTIINIYNITNSDQITNNQITNNNQIDQINNNQINQITNNQIDQINNNQINQITNNLVNNFGNENLEKIINDKEYKNKLDVYIRDGYYGMARSLINDIYFTAFDISNVINLLCTFSVDVVYVYVS